MVEKLNEDYVYEWSIIEFIINFLAIFFLSYIGGLFVILYIALQFNINLYQYFSIFTNYIVPIIFVIVMKLRKRIIKRLINRAYRKEELSLLYNNQKLLLYLEIFLPIYNMLIIYLNKIYNDVITDKNLILITSITVLYMPIYFIFNTILNEDGLVFIEFNELNTNIYNYEKRQYWLIKICKRISDIFKKGNLMVDKDMLRSDFNLQMKNSVDMKSKINEMKNWFLSSEKKDDIFSIFKTIWPKIKIVPYERLTLYKRIDLFPLEYIKLIIGFIIAIILLIQNPSLINDIIKQLIGKLL